MRTDMNEENDHGVLSSVIKNISDSWVNSNIKNNRKDKNTWIKEFSSQSYVKSGFNIAERKLEETKTEDKKDVRVQIQPDKEKKELEVWKEEQRQNIKTVFSQKHLHKSEISVEPVQQKQQKRQQKPQQKQQRRQQKPQQRRQKRQQKTQRVRM